MSGGASTPVLRQAGNQKQQGYFFPTSDSRTPCTVISELWAGWLIALPGASFTCTKLFSPQSHCPWLASLVQLHPDCECYDLSQLHNHAPPPQWCFIQGGLSLLQRLPPSWVHTVNILISMDAETAPLPAPWSSVQLWHSSYGGGYQWSLEFHYQQSFFCQTIYANASAKKNTTYNRLDP
jgi:hypothetical protein